MRIIVHDYSGHPFQAQLSRELARRGHSVDHVHCASYRSGKGHLERSESDPVTLTFSALELGRAFDKYSAARRMTQEWNYARTFLDHVEDNPPDVVLMCNVPLLAHSLIDRQLSTRKVRTVFWHQDVYSHAIGLEARRRLGAIGGVVGRVAGRLESKIAKRASAVIVISEQFLSVHAAWGTDPCKVHVIPNWAPLDEVVPRPRDNEWAREHDLTDRPVLLYSGTLGLKHDPAQLITLIRSLRAGVRDATLVVISDGRAAAWLKGTDEPGLVVLPFQPYDLLPDVLASGDLLVTILEQEASQYSVPSKSLTYLCAGRPVLALMPESNPAFSLVAAAGGLSVDPNHQDMAVVAARVGTLLRDAVDLEQRGRLARSYAESTFAIASIADRFEKVLGARSTRDQATGANERPSAVEPDTAQVARL